MSPDHSLNGSAKSESDQTTHHAALETAAARYFASKICTPTNATTIRGQRRLQQR